MGLPRHLNTKYKQLLKLFHKSDDQTKELVYVAWGAGLDMALHDEPSLYMKKGSTGGEDIKHRNKVVYSLLQRRFKDVSLYGHYPLYSVLEIRSRKQRDKLEKVEINYFDFCYLNQYKKWEVQYKKIKISLFFVEKAKEKSLILENKAKKEIELRDSIVKVREIVYSNRNFPVKLADIIKERDNFTCQRCGKTLETLLNDGEGIHLEIDHIDAWVDGGQTTYKNGQTVCSQCNKGKHHSKKYLRAVTNL